LSFSMSSNRKRGTGVTHEPKARWRTRCQPRMLRQGRFRRPFSIVFLVPHLFWRSSARQRTSLALGVGSSAFLLNPGSSVLLVGRRRTSTVEGVGSLRRITPKSAEGRVVGQWPDAHPLVVLLCGRSRRGVFTQSGRRHSWATPSNFPATRRCCVLAVPG
jgi:hypothetical protein